MGTTIAAAGRGPAVPGGTGTSWAVGRWCTAARPLYDVATWANRAFLAAPLPVVDAQAWVWTMIHAGPTGRRRWEHLIVARADAAGRAHVVLLAPDVATAAALLARSAAPATDAPELDATCLARLDDAGRPRALVAHRYEVRVDAIPCVVDPAGWCWLPATLGSPARAALLATLLARAAG